MRVGKRSGAPAPAGGEREAAGADPGRRTMTDGMARRLAGSSGAALPAPLDGRLESALGAPLGDVRVHTGAASAEAAGELGANAFALGSDIHFGADRYQPGSAQGERLIAHEVAHTVQQRGAAAEAQCDLEVGAAGDTHEVAAEAFAQSFVAAGGGAVGSGVTPSVSPGALAHARVQCDQPDAGSATDAGSAHDAEPTVGTAPAPPPPDDRLAVRWRFATLGELLERGPAPVDEHAYPARAGECRDAVQRVLARWPGAGEIDAQAAALQGELKQHYAGWVDLADPQAWHDFPSADAAAQWFDDLEADTAATLRLIDAAMFAELARADAATQGSAAAGAIGPHAEAVVMTPPPCGPEGPGINEVCQVTPLLEGGVCDMPTGPDAAWLDQITAEIEREVAASNWATLREDPGVDSRALEGLGRMSMRILTSLPPSRREGQAVLWESNGQLRALAERLDPATLDLLADAAAFDQHSRHCTRIRDLVEYMGVPISAQAEHTYTLRIEGGTAGGDLELIGAGGFLYHVTIEYHGPRPSFRVDAGCLGAYLELGVSLEAPLQFNAELESESNPTHPAEYHPPSHFTGLESIQIYGLEATVAGYGAAPTMIQVGGVYFPIPADLGLQSIGSDTASIGAEVELSGGLCGGELTSIEESPLEHVESGAEPRWVTVWAGQVGFDNRVSKIDEAGYQTLRRLLHQLLRDEVAALRDPATGQGAVRIQLIGSASGRYQEAVDEADADARNLQLSADRVAAVRAQLQAVLARSPIPDLEFDPHADGSSFARQVLGDAAYQNDDARYRTVTIFIEVLACPGDGISPWIEIGD